MKKIIVFSLITCFAISAKAQITETKADVLTVAAPDTKIVEASCSECNFGMKHTGCRLAVRIDDKPYLVEGAKIDGYGDAHAGHGLCKAIRKAEVSGDIKGDKFFAKTFKLLPPEKSKQ